MEKVKWRESHAWLAGYSDGLANVRTVEASWSDYASAYERGFQAGAEQRVAVSA